MTRFKHIIPIILLIAAYATAWAQQPSLQVRVNAQVVQGSRFTVTFRVVNADASVRQAPELKGCTLLYGPGVSTYISQEFNNGRMSTTQVCDYTFTYQADKAGTVTIPAISINAGKQTLKTQPRNITVLPPDKSQQPVSGQSAQPVRPGQTANISPNDLIVTVTLSKQKVYEQEATVATIKVYTKHNIRSFRATTLPSFDGFLSEELPVANSEARLEHFRGENYYTVDLKKCLLFPQKSGKLTINSGRYDVTLETYELVSNGWVVDRRPVQKNITTVSQSLTVNVDPLPTPQPASFSGAVGTGFKATAKIEPSLLRTNEAATYTYTVTGNGNINYITAPKIDFGNNAEEYQPETSSDAIFNGTTLAGTTTTTYTFVPQHPGQVKIEAHDFAYFDPVQKKYITVPVKGFDLRVIQGSESATAMLPSTTKIEDILHIKKLDAGDLIDRNDHENGTYIVPRIIDSPLYYACYIVIIAALLTAILVYRRNIRLNADASRRRKARAARSAEKRLRMVKKYMAQGQTDKFYNAMTEAIKGYLGDKLDINASALTRDTIKQQLEEKGASPETVALTMDILDRCEMARYAPGQNAGDVSTIYALTQQAIEAIEKTKIAKAKREIETNHDLI